MRQQRQTHMRATLVELYWQRKREIVGEKPVSVPLRAPQTQCGVPWDRITVSWCEAAAKRAIYGVIFVFSRMMHVMNFIWQYHESVIRWTLIKSSLSGLHRFRETSYCALMIAFVKVHMAYHCVGRADSLTTILRILSRYFPVIKIVVMQIIICACQHLIRQSANWMCVCVCVGGGGGMFF
jgi:hypothetical protein